MSETYQKIPFLSLDKLNSLSADIHLARAGEGWDLTNRIEDEDAMSIVMWVNHYKAYYQLNCILTKYEGIKARIESFSDGNFQKYIDSYLEYADDETPPFDPYVELEYLLCTDGIEDLPEQIEQFYNLLEFAQTQTIRSQVMHEAFESLFGGKLKAHYECKDDDGASFFVSEDELPPKMVEDLKLNSEVKREIKAIEAEHCLDNYNEWYQALSPLVSERRPFADMLPLCK